MQQHSGVDALTLITLIAAAMNFVIATYLIYKMAGFIRGVPRYLFYAMFVHSLFTWMLLAIFIIVYTVILFNVDPESDPGTYVLRPLMPMVFVQLTVSVAIEAAWLSAMGEPDKDEQRSNGSIGS